MTADAKRGNGPDGGRTEHDLLGERVVPADAYWGIHTLRAAENFRLSGRPVHPALIRALALVKKACARANAEIGALAPEIARAIEDACDDLAEGRIGAGLPLDAVQGGAGTSTNMAVNEIVANRALERMGRTRGDYAVVHPIDHVNLHQSTNDVYPTALKVACIGGLREAAGRLAALQGAFQDRERAWAGIVAPGRTELQDAVPLTLGAQFSAFAEAVGRDRWRTFKCEERLRVVNLGGTAVGTGLAAPRAFIFRATERLRDVTGLGLARAENLVDQTANADAFVEVSGILAAAGGNLIKIAGDLRLLHFLGEIRLPARQAGSSIMPGKVNPVIAEAAISAGLLIRANDALVGDAVSRGTLQISEFLPVAALALLESLDLLARSASMLADSVARTEADAVVCRAHAEASESLVAAFVPRLGYDGAQALVAEFRAAGGGNLRAFLAARLGAELADRTLSPENLMALGHRDEPGAGGEGAA